MDQVLDWQAADTVFLINDRWPMDVRKYFADLVQKAQEKIDLVGAIVIPTSGTTTKDLRQTKLVVLNRKCFLNSAVAVGEKFKFSDQDRVALTLPRFHVGGLSQVARAHIWKQKIFDFQEAWNAEAFFQFLLEHKITQTSLVPAQLYDLISSGKKAPVTVNTVFLGGGAIGHELLRRARESGWPVHVTYGMTETASMIAFDDGFGFSALPHAELAISGQLLKVRASSLFAGYLVKENDQIILDGSQITDRWFTTQDLAIKKNDKYFILGRKGDYAKINGEGVYLTRLQLILQDTWLQVGRSLNDGILRFVESDRSGSEIHLISILPELDVRPVIAAFNEKVLPFERIRGFHQVEQIPTTALGKVRWQEIK